MCEVSWFNVLRAEYNAYTGRKIQNPGLRRNWRSLSLGKTVCPPQARKFLEFHYAFYFFALIFSVSDIISLKFLGACGAQIPKIRPDRKDFGKSSQDRKVWLPPPPPPGEGALDQRLSLSQNPYGPSALCPKCSQNLRELNYQETL